jgi:Transposase, Mutator family
VLLGLAPGSRESYENWLAFGRDVVDRRLRSPGLIVADGAPGLCKAARELWPAAEEQRCTVHALRNLTGKLPERHHRGLKRAGGASSTTPPVPPTRAAALRRSSPTTGPRTRQRWPLRPVRDVPSSRPFSPSSRWTSTPVTLPTAAEAAGEPPPQLLQAPGQLPGLAVTAFGTEGRLYRQGLEIGRTWRVTAYACTRGMPRSRSSPPRTWTATCARATWSATARYPTSASDGWSISPYAA